MRLRRMPQILMMMATGTVVLQMGCNFSGFNEFLQTVLLGITAAGAVAIIQNI